MTDTVGFIQKLPTELIAAFRATLEEILEADLIVHVVDASHGNVMEQAETVVEVLGELGAGDIPVLVVLNKCDLLPNASLPSTLAHAYPDSVSISALTGKGLDLLRERIEETLVDQMSPIEVLIPYKQGELVDLFHRSGVVMRQQHLSEGTLLSGRLPHSLQGRFQPHIYVDAPDDLTL